MTNDEATMAVIRFLVSHDMGPHQFYFNENGRIAVHENCNDLFAWACADSEEITVSDIPEYQKAIDECMAVNHIGYAGELWACRKRGMKPQPPVLAKMPENLRPLFDAVEVK